jgi:hypothetical protein
MPNIIENQRPFAFSRVNPQASAAIDTMLAAPKQKNFHYSLHGSTLPQGGPIGCILRRLGGGALKIPEMASINFFFLVGNRMNIHRLIYRFPLLRRPRLPAPRPVKEHFFNCIEARLRFMHRLVGDKWSHAHYVKSLGNSFSPRIVWSPIRTCLGLLRSFCSTYLKRENQCLGLRRIAPMHHPNAQF